MRPRSSPPSASEEQIFQGDHRAAGRVARESASLAKHRPDRKAKPPMPGEVDSRLFEQSPQVVVPKHKIPAGFSLSEKPRPKPGEVDAILKKFGVRP